MTDLITREWNGKTIRQREDGYICLTDMAKACGKEFKEWYRTNKAKELIRAVASEVGIPTSAVVERVSSCSKRSENFRFGSTTRVLSCDRQSRNTA